MRLITILCILILFGCKKEPKDPVYQLNDVYATPFNANKNKLKTTHQYILIMYANLFQKALSPNQLVEITRCIESIGDKQLAHEVVLSNFMNKPDVIMPTYDRKIGLDTITEPLNLVSELNDTTVIRPTLESFLEDIYKRFFVRDITEAEKTYFINFFHTNPTVTVEMVYTAFALSNENQYY
ncbi:MAG: hypothetical protein VX347_01785 [Bacteroidota bacterium]|nr:hypothetical protein [Bacteroidota bacterium]